MFIIFANTISFFKKNFNGFFVHILLFIILYKYICVYYHILWFIFFLSLRERRFCDKALALEVLVEEIINQRKTCAILSKKNNIHEEKRISFTQAAIILNVLVESSDPNSSPPLQKNFNILLDLSNPNYSKIPVSELAKSWINKILKNKMDSGVVLEDKRFFTKKSEPNFNFNFAQIVTPICIFFIIIIP